MATSLLIPAQQSTSKAGGGVFVGHTAHSPPVASTAESTAVLTTAQSAVSGRTPQTATPTAMAIERRKKKPYKELTLEEKVQLIRLAEENAGLSQASIAERYAIAKSNVCRILQRKHEYLRAFECAGFAGSRKRKLRGEPDAQHTSRSTNTTIVHRQSTSPTSQRQLPTIPAPKPRYYIPSAPLKEANELRHSDLIDSRLLQSPIENRFGNETLRAHMYKQHQISRMFMCRCCNWAFPDKTSLHMHMQAKEEGKTISVPVIGKGNPPQHQSATTTHGASSTPQTPALHIPQARAPAPNPFAPLQLHALPTHQPLSIADPSALQAAAATLFPQMALLRGAAANTMPADELMSKLRERLMLNNLVAQSGFGLAAWLAGFPKIDQPGLGSMGATNNDISVSKEEPGADIGDEEDEINVDKEVDEEMPLERDRHNDDDNIIIADEFVNKEVGKEATLHMDERHERDENRGHENEDGLRPSEIRMSNGSTTGNSSSPSSNAMPNLRSAINATPLNGLDYKKRMLVSPPRRNISDALLNIAATQPTLPTTEQSPNGQDNHISPAETNSSISPSTESGRECYECSVYKGKLAVAENRCRYLEGRTATLQSDALRFSTRVSVSENSARQFEREGRVLREQNELLQRKLLECQEKTLTFMQGDQANNPQAVAIYLNDILKTTFLH